MCHRCDTAIQRAFEKLPSFVLKSHRCELVDNAKLAIVHFRHRENMTDFGDLPSPVFGDRRGAH